MIAPTPRDLLVDHQGHPYFLWDMEMTLDEFERALRESDPYVRAYLVGKLMRQAKPDDVLQFVSPQSSSISGRRSIATSARRARSGRGCSRGRPVDTSGGCTLLLRSSPCKPTS